MQKIKVMFGLSILILGLFGCATPGGMKWNKAGHSIDTTNADVHDCQVSTALWWPFDDLSKCMHRRGYKLIGENEEPQKIASNKEKTGDYDKLVELKKLKDNGIISNEEYENKRKKYLSEY
jgi:hypothetical protein